MKNPTVINSHKHKKIQIANNINFSVHMIYYNDEVVLQVRNRKTGEIKHIPVANMSNIPVTVHYFKSSLLYRLYFRAKYGHACIELPNGNVINCDIKEAPHGLLKNMNIIKRKPDLSIKTHTCNEYIQLAIVESLTPVSLSSALKGHHCISVSALALFGSKTKDAMRKLFLLPKEKETAHKSNKQLVTQ